MARFWKAVRDFAGDRRGNFAILLGIALPVLATGAGFGVNTAQLFNAKSALQHSLDAAVASTARSLTIGAIREEDAHGAVAALLSANGGGAFGRDGIVTLDEVIVDRTAKTVDATATANITLAFPLFGAEPVRKVGARTAAVYSDQTIEVAMMLDVTGSMDGQKIRDLRSAATNAVDALLGGQNARNPRVRVSIIPYAQAVNVGALARESVFREAGGGSDLPPYIGAPQSYVRENTGPAVDLCATERKMPDGSADISSAGPMAERSYMHNGERRRYLARVNRDDRLKASDCPRAAVVPLTADADALKRSINAFSATGWTAGAIGIQWTRYMLSSDWRRTIVNARLGEGPADEDPKKVRKIAILMTDGEFNTVYAGGNASQDVTKQGRASRANAEALCTAMKNDGIEIFTIGFDLRERNARAVLRNCASPDTSSIRHYFEASTGPELDAAFQEIIRTTERLYLSM
jgi:Flp pilus assembly protein TadG